MGEKSQAIEDILDALHETAEKGRTVSVDDTVAAIGNRGWGPFLFVPAIVEISPVGGIPGVPTLLALIIAIFAVQIALGREHLWLPRFLGQRAVSSDRMRHAIETIRPIGTWLDRWFHGRLPYLMSDKVTRLAAVVVLLLTLTPPPLEFVPFAGTAPMAAIAVFGLALMFCDGLLMALGFELSVAAAAAALGMWGGS
jgi:hypothetical protein